MNNFSKYANKKFHKFIQKSAKATGYYKDYIKKMEIVYDSESNHPISLNCIMREGIKREFYPDIERLEETYNGFLQ